MKSKKTLYLLSLIMAIGFMTSCRTPKDLVYRNFKNLSIAKLGFASSTIKVDLICYNPNNFGLQLKTTDLDIWINNNYLGHTAQDYQVSIAKRQEFTLPVQINVDMKNMFLNTINTLLGKEVKVKVTGQVKVGMANIFKTFPVSYESVQKFSLF